MAWKIFAREKFWVGKNFGGGNELGGPGGPPKPPKIFPPPQNFSLYSIYIYAVVYTAT